MGYDIERIHGDVDEEFLCSICAGVLEDPLVTTCEHVFCSNCIKEWLSKNLTCPIDRQHLTLDNLKPASQKFRNILSPLKIRCEHSSLGCDAIIDIENLNLHQNECDFNPKKLIPCKNGCGTMMLKFELKDHNCVRDLRGALQKIKEGLDNLKVKQLQMNKEISFLMNCWLNMRSVNLNVPSSLFETYQQSEAERWARTLPKAKVTRWGGMVSTPDNALQTLVRRALIDSRCPWFIINELTENSHERRWPSGLSSLEIRQMNRRFYDNYTCRKIPFRQAVVVMSCDNSHMLPNMLLDPGFVLIFYN